MTKSDANLSFFLIFKDGAVLRLGVTAAVQAELSKFFTDAIAAFTANKERVHFGGALSADEDELLEITDFDLPKAMDEAAAAPLSKAAVSKKMLDEGSVKGIFAAAIKGSKKTLAFQVLDRRQVLSTKSKTLLLDKEVFRRLDQPGLTVGDQLTAVVLDDTLLFMSYFQARRLFDLGKYYRVASDPDLVQFTKHHRLHFEDADGFRDKADDWTRRRVALIEDSNVLQYDAKKIVRVAAQFDIQLPLKSGRIVIPAEKKQFKDVIRLLSDDLLESPLTGDRFVAASKRKLPKKK